ncbi:MAG: MraY family glycosyltransferase [Luteimonas sp.]
MLSLSALTLWAPPLAILLTLLVLTVLNPVAARFGLLDHPQGRKDHARPTPVTGGLAMAIGSMVVAGSLQEGRPLLAFLLAAAMLVAVGLLDDIYDLRWWWRILAQVLAALVMVEVGGVRIEQLGQLVGMTGTGLGVLSVPFTVFAAVGIINAVNMIDGADGLAGSLVLAALVMLAAAALYSGNGALADRTLILAGAVTGFLVWNIRHPWRTRAKVFMGNAGSAFLGLVIAWVSFRLTQNPGHPVSPVLALWLLPIPIVDCLVLIARRTREGRSPFAAGRDHIHHFMIDAGITPGWVTFWLTGFSLLCGVVIGQAMRADVPNILLLLAFSAVCIWWYWLTARRERALGFFRHLRSPRHAVRDDIVR